MERTKRAGWLLGVTVALVGCRSAPEPFLDAEEQTGALLAGFDPPEPAADWRAGDRVLYALTTTSAKRTQTKLIEIELLGRCTLVLANSSSLAPFLFESVTLTATVGSKQVEWSSELLRLGVRVFEADGRLVQRTEAKVPETVLRSGLVPGLEFYAALKDRAPGDGTPIELTDQEVRVFGEMLAMLPTLLQILQDDGVLEPLLRGVVGPPPLLSLLKFRGIEIGVSAQLQDAAVLGDHPSHPSASGPIHRLPLQLTVNDAPALDLSLEVTRTDPPLRLSGGILALRGVACRGAERSVTLELRAARRGPPGAELRW